MKFGKNKANFVENKIRIIKRLLYMQLRDTLSQNWPELLPKVVENYNNTPLQHLGYLKPNDIKHDVDSFKVQEAQSKHNFKTFKEPGLIEQKSNEKKYLENSHSFKVGQYVYADLEEKLFDKSFHIKVGQRTIISSFSFH